VLSLFSIAPDFCTCGPIQEFQWWAVNRLLEFSRKFHRNRENEKANRYSI
jgi:hypothetical protein